MATDDPRENLLMRYRKDWLVDIATGFKLSAEGDKKALAKRIAVHESDRAERLACNS